MADEDDGSVVGSGARLPFTAFVLFEAALAPLALAIGWGVGRNPLEGFAWDADAAETGVLAALPMVGLLLAALRSSWGPLDRMRAFFDRELAPILEGCTLPDLALLAIVAGLGEEMLFRGLIQGGLTAWLGVGGAIAATSVLFGVVHPASLTYMIVAGLMGAYLGTVWVLTGNLLTVMVTHALYDFAALVILLNEGEGEEED